ncbi:MAG: thiamine phosphate synthase [Nocardioidaceae bacterium]
MTRPSRTADPALAHRRVGPPAPPASSLPRLLLLTDRSQLRLGRALARTVAECVDAGLTHVVLRELDLPHPHRAALATELAAVGATVIAAHTPLPACAGLHLPAAGGARTVHPAGLAGRSCHSRAEVAAAAAAGFDFATLGPYAATASKPGYGPALAHDDYARHPIAVYALGGIGAHNAAAARAAGAYGVAVMGAVMRAADPAAVVRDLLEAVG